MGSETTTTAAAASVIIAMDGSEHSDYAFRYYVQNIHRPENQVMIVYCPEFHNVVYTHYSAADVQVLMELMKQEDEKVTQQLQEFSKKLKNAGISGKVKSIVGNPGEVIVRLAKEENATLIVTGTRGLGIIRRTIMGSISDYIIHHSHIPVLVCRKKDH